MCFTLLHDFISGLHVTGLPAKFQPRRINRIDAHVLFCVKLRGRAMLEATDACRNLYIEVNSIF
jgi:hypothetical protein